MRADFKARFDALCRNCVSLCDLRDSDGIGTYQEKPLHKMLKRAVTDDASCFEVRVGNYVADVREQGRIAEIQTGGFYPLADKLRYFLDETEDEITVVHPIDAELTIVRVDPETGEVLSRKRSPKHESVRDVLPELFYLRHVFPSPRLNICIVSLRAEEYRYSERMRHRRAGAYDACYLPLECLSVCELATCEDVRAYLPSALLAGEEMTAEEFGRAMGLRKGRRRSVLLAFLCEKEILCRRKEGRKFLYRCATKR